MASNQTDNFGLSQWLPEDKVLREEFNQDNAKIDMALRESSRLICLADVRLPTEQSEIVLDLKDVSLENYCKLELWAPKLIGASSGTVKFLLNDISDSVYYTKSYHDTNESADTAMLFISLDEIRTKTFVGAGMCVINLFGNALCGKSERAYTARIDGIYRATNMKSMWGIHYYTVSRDTLTHLTITSSSPLLPESRVVLFGIRI